MTDNTPIYLIFGASSEIAQAVTTKLCSDNITTNVFCFSRSASHVNLDKKVNWTQVDNYESESLSKALSTLKIEASNIAGVFVFNGILHHSSMRPEKALSQFEPANFNQVIHANTTTPVEIIKAVISTFGKILHCKIAVLSARIGSIGDNGLGGWHSYRASKAALNMLLVNIAIECSRSFKGIKLISYHPGTTDTPLSKPFQQNVAPEQLFSAERSADYFLEVVENQKFDQQLSYVDWQGKTIPW